MKEEIKGIKKDLYHDLCHNKSLAFSFATGILRYRMTITKPPFTKLNIHSVKDVKLLPFTFAYKDNSTNPMQLQDLY